MRSAESYVAATRRLRPDAVARKYYDGLFAAIEPLARAYGASPTFYSTYSTERTCETVKFGNQTVIIYDQYLGQTFNQMNRLWLNSTNPEEMIAYAFKVMAERAQVTGRLKLALVLAGSHHVMNCRSQTYKVDVDARRRGFLTYVQERYVLFHELFHAILDNQPDYKLKVINDARRDYLDNYLRPRLDLIVPGVPEAAAEFDRLSMLQKIDHFEADDALAEECVCDTMAIPALFYSLSGKEGFTPADVRSGIFFALRHLRTLASIRATIDDLGSGADDGDQTWMDTYLVRTGFQQWVLKTLAAEGGAPASDVSDTDFMAEQARYEEYVEDPVLFELQRRLERVPEEVLQAVDDYAEIEMLNAQIDHLLSNQEAKDRLRRIGEDRFLFPLAETSNEDIARLKRELDQAVASEQSLPQSL